jgi:hypothetical protein
MFKRIALVAVLGIAGSLTAAGSSDAGIFFRPIAPVRRVAARAILPPYPVARRVITGPLYGPVVGPAYGVGYAPAIYGAPYGYGYGAPYVYGSGVSVVVGY